MRNLLLIFTKYFHVFLFLSLEAVCFFLIFRYNPYQNAVFFNASNAFLGTIYSTFTDYEEYFKLEVINDSLIAENARLKAQLEYSHLSADTAVVEVRDSLYDQRYTYIPAKVVRNSLEKGYNYLTFNRGALHGVGRRMGVITANGVVGVTNSASERFSTALSVLHMNFSISARIDEINEIGSVRWDGTDPEIVYMNDIPLQARVKEGQHVYTSPFSPHFPENIPIGQIISVERSRSNNFYILAIRLSVSMRNVTHVYIVNNLMKDERENLEAQIEE
ncbi:MAG: rod shape-determining protein MreC [Bacteroidia bacterium]